MEKRIMKYCPYCMQQIEGTRCPNCKKDVKDASNGTNLAVGTILNAHYVLGRCLGAGGFGVTYLAKDLNLDRIVAIKEYFPSCWAFRGKNAQEVCAIPAQQQAYERGKRRFLKEGRMIAKAGELSHVVNVYASFDENGTSYLVMDYLEGETLAQRVEAAEQGRLQLDKLLPKLLPLMEDIDRLHRMDPQILHRDITPGNIMYSHGKLWLIDFGSARQVLGDKTMAATASQGFAPPEQFSRENQGPYTDVYAMAATILYCITGKRPQDSTDRVFNDQLVFPGDLPEETRPPICEEQNAALKHAMALQYDRRTPTMAAFIAEFTQNTEEAPKHTPHPSFLKLRQQVQEVIKRVPQFLMHKKWVLPAAAAIVLAAVIAIPKPDGSPQQESPSVMANVPELDEQEHTVQAQEMAQAPAAGQTAAPPKEQTLQELTLENCEVTAGQVIQLTPSMTPRDYQSAVSAWESSDSAVASVSKSGKVTAEEPGTARITLTVDGIKTTCTITVLEAVVSSVTLQSGPTKTEYYAGMSFDPTGITLDVTYSNGKIETVTSGFELSGYTATPGEKTVVVSYDDMQIGTIHVTVKPKEMIQDAGDAGFPGYNLVNAVQYNKQVYYTKMSLRNSGWVYSIYRQDTPSAEPVCVYTREEGFIGNFFLLKDRIFFATSIGGKRTIATVDLDGNNFYAITKHSKDCIGCYYSSGWIYSYSAEDGRLVRFRTDGSQYEWVGDAEITSGGYCISEQRVIYKVNSNGSTIIKCFSTEKETTTTLRTLPTESVWLIGVYGDSLLYNMYDALTDGTATVGGKWKLYLYNLKSGTTYELGRNKADAAIWNDQIFVCDESGNAELRQLCDPMVVTQEFKLPKALMSNINVSASRVLPVGNDLAFITDGNASEKILAEVILINGKCKQIAALAVEQDNKQ